MFDTDILDALEYGVRRQVEEALAVLAESGIIQAQRLRSFTRIADAADQTEVNALASSLENWRKQARLLDSLQTQGESFVKERNDESEE